MEQGIARYVKTMMDDCDFSPLFVQGYEVSSRIGDVQVRVREGSVVVTLDGELAVMKEGEEGRLTSRSYTYPSPLGALYEQALAWYEQERTSALLENYTVDVLVNYAPVDGVEITCGPAVWESQTVVDTLRAGLEANLGALRSGGTGYFALPAEGSAPVRVLTTGTWPGRIEIYGEGVTQGSMIASPVGTQQGLGALGFCYVPYHFVYDLIHPVLVQFGESDGTLFQFPLVLVVDKNQPRQGLEGTIDPGIENSLCAQRTEPFVARVLDVAFEEISNASITYTCFDQTCPVGEGTGTIEGLLPGCVNGEVTVRAPGFTERSVVYTSLEGEPLDIILDKEHSLDISLVAGGQDVGERALISFTGPVSQTVVLPDTKQIVLSEGLYNVSVLVYGNTSIRLEASTTQQCVDVPIGGIGGLFGGTKEQCYTTTIPASTVEYALLGGGIAEVYLFPEDLERGKLRIALPSLQKPTSLDQLQTFYERFTTQSIEVTL
jgi:hypothetical protein